MVDSCMLLNMSGRTEIITMFMNKNNVILRRWKPGVKSWVLIEIIIRKYTGCKGLKTIRKSLDCYLRSLFEAIRIKNGADPLNEVTINRIDGIRMI